MAKADPEMIAQCDVLCPNRQIFLGANDAYRAFYAQRRAAGTALEFYSCSGPARLLDPYTYYRLQAWTCWKEGAVASYFWAFGDNAGVSSWNEYLAPRGTYTPIFLDKHSVTAAKELEACREGIEDYQYLLMLRDAVDEAVKQGASGAAVESARKLLTDAPDRVLGPASGRRFRWDSDADRTVADQVRVEILEALAALPQEK
jgi:hypothetical protein